MELPEPILQQINCDLLVQLNQRYLLSIILAHHFYSLNYNVNILINNFIYLRGSTIHHPGSFAAEGIIVHKRRLSPALAFVDIRIISAANFNPDIGSQILLLPKLEIKLTGNICASLKKDAVKISKSMNQFTSCIYFIFIIIFSTLDQINSAFSFKSCNRSSRT